MGHLSKEIVAAMELAIEAECMGLEELLDRAEYVANGLTERFPALETVTIVAVATQIVDTRNRGLW